MNNNPRFNPTSSKTESIQSDIDTTRRRMDDTIDAITSRLKGRHVVDEVIGFFRSSDAAGNGNAARLKEKVTEGASTAMHTVVDTVKAHPLPTLLIGAGIAWMLYEKRRPSYSADYDPDDYARREAGYGGGWEEDVPYDYPASDISGAPSVFSGDTGTEPQGKMEEMKEQVSSKLGATTERLRHRAEEMKARYREGARHLGERVQSGYSTARRQITTTVDQHPLESGIACLALGVIAGLLIPTPRAIRERVAPTAQRLRERARETGHDLVERGRHIAEAAAEAAREEAQHQGLTPEALKAKAEAVAERARDATKEAASNEGLNPAASGGTDRPGAAPNPSSPNPSGF